MMNLSHSDIMYIYNKMQAMRMNKNIKTTTSVSYLKQELIKCNQLTEDNINRAAIINWRLNAMGQ